jgi:predicted regulator of Ras-like GTPase activity (Roadblock/LC7/MglB family)
MAKIQDFVAEVGQMPGVKGYLLVDSDGRSLARTLPDSEQIGSMIVLIRLAAEKMSTALGLERLRHFVLREGETSFLTVFPLGRYVLAVEQTPQPGIDLPLAIRELVGRFQRQKG